MRKGYSIVVTTTHSGKSRYVFLSKKWLNAILTFIILALIIIVVVVFNYSTICYQALEAVALRRRNAEMEREFAKLQEIRRNLEISEMNNEKLRIMLGVEKTPVSVEPTIHEIDTDYSEKINMMAQNEENIPSLLPTVGHVSRKFGSEHQGIDIAAPRFSPVVAAASGIIEAAGWDSIFGNYVIVYHNSNYSTFYGHLHSINVRNDDNVASGEVIGTIGSTGKSTSPHLHYEVRFRGNPVEPLGYMPFLLSFEE